MRSVEQLSLAFEAPAAAGPAEDRVQLVELTPFPRRSAREGTFHGFSRGGSDSAICVVTEQAVEVGALLRVVVERIDGRPGQRRIARVIWTAPHDARRQRVGLAFIADESQVRSMRSVRPARSLRLAREQRARTGSG